MKQEIDHGSKTPLHQQAEQMLRRLIKEEAYKSGKLLPNENDLSKQIGISRQTLRQALNTLVHEGILARKKGVGTWVSSTPVSSKSNNWLSFSQEMKARGIIVRNFELHVSWVLPDAEVRAFFQLDEKTKVLKLVRLRGDQANPFVYFISYFHPDTGLTGDEDFKMPLYDILLKDHGIKAQLSKEEISARTADKTLTEKFGVTTGVPVLFRKRFVYDSSKKPIEFNLGYYKADSFVYTVESTRD